MRATIRSRRRIGQVGVSLVGALALLPFVRPALFWLLSSDALVSVALGVLYQPPTGGTPEGPHRAVYSLANAHPVARGDRRFLSVALDTSLVAGGHWWSADG
ncbi:MAG: hypothetical protein OXU20_10265, partial [Myxococcales bacterium]|nr:hypothetical protein [Myxococcales bacterium]